MPELGPGLVPEMDGKGTVGEVAASDTEIAARVGRDPSGFSNKDVSELVSRGSGPLVSLSFDHNSVFSLCPFFFLFRDQSNQSVHRDN
jgi:hypothetical protein